MATKSKTLADFRAAHDQKIIIPARIRAALAAMRKIGAEHWEYEVEFMKLAHLSASQIGQFRSQFEAHVVETPHTSQRAPRRVWFADTKAATRARGDL